MLGNIIDAARQPVIRTPEPLSAEELEERRAYYADQMESDALRVEENIIAQALATQRGFNRAKVRGTAFLD